MTKWYYFRCKSNPINGPLLKLLAGEAREMKNHPDYERVDEFGEIIPVEDEMDGTLPFQGAKGRK